MMTAKVQEAVQHIKTAEKQLKTSLLRWKPDYDSAADEYSLAAQCYRIARDVNKSKDCHLKACEYYRKNKSFFHAAKALENAILVCKETASPTEIYHLATDASSLYQQHGSGDSAANVLEKAAKIIEDIIPNSAISLYQQAAEISAAQSSQHQGIEYISRASRLLVKNELYDDAVDSIRQEITFHLEAGNSGAVGRLCVAAVLVHIARGDCVAARKAYEEWGSNCEQTECYTIEGLISSVEEHDNDGLLRALCSPFIRCMDVEYSRLARQLLPPAGHPEVGPHTVLEGPGGNKFEDIEEDPYETVLVTGKSDAGGSLC